MGNIDDFLISLGFDTTKLKGQLDKIHNDLEKAAGVAAKRKTKTELTEAEKIAKIKKQIADREERKAIADKEKLRNADFNSHVVAFQKHQNKLAAIEAKKKPDKIVKQQDMNAHVVQFQKQQAKIERDKKAADLRSARNSERVLQASLKRKEQIQARWDNRRLQRQQQGVMRERFAGLARDVSTAARGRGVDSELTSEFSKKIISSRNVTEAKQYADALRQVSTRMNALDRGKRAQLLNLVRQGDMSRLVLFNRELGKTAAEMNKARRSAIGLNAAQNGLHDSTRNLIRQYASLYAIFAGTAAISHQAKAMDGANAGLTAVTGNAQEAAHSLQFITKVAEQNGLAIADAAKDYVKFKAAVGDMHTMRETEEMFTDLTKAGVVFQLSQDDMKGIIRAKRLACH